MTNAIIALLRNRVVRTFITELFVGLAVGVVTTLKCKDKNEKRKRVLLHMQEGSSDSRSDRSETEMRTQNTRSTTCEKRESWSRERSNERDYL